MKTSYVPVALLREISAKNRHLWQYNAITDDYDWIFDTGSWVAELDGVYP